jgi:hypothetical protein
MSKSNPSLFGKLTATIFDEYPIYIYKISSELIKNYLPDKLVAFAETSLTNLAKREFFYSKPIIFASRSQISDQFEELSHSITIEDLLENFLSKTNEIIRYNFVITGNCLILVKIAHVRHFSYHLLCKHITLSNRSDDVRFAGELWRDEKNIFRFNNNSGTYRPLNILIEKVNQVFNQLTPHLQFQGISFEISSRPSFTHRFIFKVKNKKNQINNS